MKRTLNINLGGYPFTLDEDAYSHLIDYIAELEAHFRLAKGKDEIITDIEIRLAELLKAKLGEKQIGEIRDVNHIIGIMGSPEELEDDDQIEEKTKTSFEGTYKTGKRLFRDPEDKKLGGVSSGLAAYFGIDDPIWVRIVFVLIALSGIGILPYIILWIFVPEAKSSSDRLSMRGEKINLHSIADEIEDQLHHVSDSFQNFSDKIKNKRRNKRNRKNKNFHL
jgi:phage shock protein PspC (stress-responsive transcriptional regulator)